MGYASQSGSWAASAHGVPLGSQSGGRQVGGPVQDDRRLVQCDPDDQPRAEGACEDATGKGYPCGARVVKSGPYAGRKCAGHVKAAEKHSSQE